MVLMKDQTLQHTTEQTLLHLDPSSLERFEIDLQQTVAEMADLLRKTDKPYSGSRPEDIKHALASSPPASLDGEPFADVLEDIKEKVVKQSVMVQHPYCMAHLQCPPMIPALAGEIILNTLNQSMDSWDQSPAATFTEERLISWLGELFQFSPEMDGVFTSGGTQSNYMGLLMARNQYANNKLDHDIKQEGLPPEASRFRIFTSERAHFTVKQAASQLGLGEKSVVSIPVNEKQEMDAAACSLAVAQARENGLLPIAIFATAGTTDYGSVDPLYELAALAKQEDIWFHVDAAYGAGLILSDKHADQIKGVEAADSLTIDFHKLFYQPVSCGAFLINEGNNFQYTSHYADYLNPPEDEESGMVHLAGKSVQTSRRFDALKLWMTLRCTGTKAMGGMIDQTIEAVQFLYEKIQPLEEFEVPVVPQSNALVFRYREEGTAPEVLDEWNRRIKEELFFDGTAVLAKTRLEGRQYLKVTLLNPGISEDQIITLIRSILTIGRRLKEEEARG
ncbi:L-2,4-diaminobutyrate decarboxylase [Sinobaca qinghaiensis]|uniref:L-2,4-diaminobutyrate decarboxylase n=1 Tax=Sinobaca qinghaiensis TaxID=342944 RepID=A0A419V712_9BACL|nr:aspartate aminotransferase family protein [Sinobaca qinghaiensis]RKD75876.1 L-2,4-diaminobutyrate decarboxylase [Sinobaca qinghaiensis]